MTENEISTLLQHNQKTKRINLDFKVYGLSAVNLDQEIHYIIYRIDNILNGKYYIGQHETLDIFDGYSGSGYYLNNAQKKYGLSAFTKTILYDLSSFDEMNNKEHELVQLSNCYPYDPMSYNLREGGSQGRLSEHSLSIGAQHRKITLENKTPEEREKYSKECSIRLSGNGNPMYGRDWRDGKTIEELNLRSQRIKDGHKRRTIEQKKLDKEKELTSKQNRPQYLKDIHHAKCVAHGYENWNDPIIRQKMLDSKNNKSQEQKNIENEKRSKGVHLFWDNHPEERQRIKNKLSGKGNGMYGRRKMRLISNPSIKVFVNQQDVQKYLDMGYEFSNIAHRNKKSK